MAYETGAIAILPPTQGAINVLTLTTSASVEQDIGESRSTQGRYVTFSCDAAFFITFHNVSGAITDPDGTATAGNARTWRIAADTPTSYELSALGRYFKARGSAAGTLRWYVSGRPGARSD